MTRHGVISFFPPSPGPRPPSPKGRWAGGEGAVATAWGSCEFIYVALSVTVFILGLGAHEAQCQAPSPKTVLMLNSYRSGYTWTDDQVRGVRSVLSDQPYPVELYVEYMDTARRPDEKHLDALKAFYQAKYGGRPLDLILSTDDAALQFLLKSRDSLFGRKPLVFCGVNNTELAAQASRDTMTGVIRPYLSGGPADPSAHCEGGPDTDGSFSLWNQIGGFL
jgi:hypothetical protein